MIISRTPLRISFVGGGSDIYSYYKYRCGAVVTTAINKYIYITVNKKFDNKIRVSYSQTENVDNVNQIKHPLIRECLKLVGIENGIEVTSMSDIPSEGTGLGSSSSYTVGLLNALYAYKGKFASAEKLARDACKIEIDILKDPIGKQDQYIAAYGGFQFIKFFPDGSVSVDPIIFSQKTKKKLKNNLLLFYTNITRSSSKILSKQTSNLRNNVDKRLIMDKMVSLAFSLRKSLNDNSLKNFGGILNENWILKKKMAIGISNHRIDKWYEDARKYGSLGGKILGAGGGGFLLLYANKSNHRNIIKKLSLLKATNFEFEQEGSKIIFINE